MSQSHYFVACPGVLGIRSNLPNFKWSFGTSMPEATRAEYEACETRAYVRVDNELTLPPLEQREGKYHYWSGSEGQDAIYYDRSLYLGKRLQIAATDLLGDEPVIHANTNYHRYISHRFMNLHSLGYMMTDLCSLLMLRKGYSPIHCSSFKLGDATVVIVAPPNTGKTLTSVLACMEHGADYIAEDLAMTDGHDVISVPWTSTFRYYKQIDNSLFARAKNRATKILPPLELLTASQPDPITSFIDPTKVESRSEVTHLVILQSGDQEIRSADSEEAYRKTRNLNRYEFNYHRAPMVVAAEFFTPQLGIAEACDAEDRILGQLIDNVDQRLIVQSMDPTKYVGMILEAIGQPIHSQSHPQVQAA